MVFYNKKIKDFYSIIDATDRRLSKRNYWQHIKLTRNYYLKQTSSIGVPLLNLKTEQII